MADEQKKPTAGKYYLRASARHPRRSYRIGRHEIGAVCKEFELNEEEAKELQTAGPRAWVEVLDEKHAKADAKEAKRLKKAGVSGLFEGVKESV